MRLLLDTHTFLWFINDSPELSKRALNLLESDNTLFISTASLWEIAIKVNIGKLTLPKPYRLFIPRQLKINRIDELPVRAKHLAAFSTLPLHHRDPFDRMLIAQAIAEKLPIVGTDSIFDAYSIKRLW